MLRLRPSVRADVNSIRTQQRPSADRVDRSVAATISIGEHMTESIQSADGSIITYQTAGTGPALIIVGGAFNDRQSAAPLVPLLAEHFSVHSFDRRGRGDSTDNSSHPPYLVEREVDDLQALIAQAGGSAMLYGHSSGGVLALEATMRGLPVTKVAVYEPPYSAGSDRQESIGAWARRIDLAVADDDPERAAEIFLGQIGGDALGHLKQAPWWPHMVAVAHTLPYDVALVGDGSMPTERLSALEVPVLVMDGGQGEQWRRDAVVALAAAIPGARHVTIEGQGHAVAHEVIAPQIIEFFR